MKKIVVLTLIALLLLPACATSAAAAPSANVPNTPEAKATQAALEKYMTALQNYTPDALLALYADDLTWTNHAITAIGDTGPMSKSDLKYSLTDIWGPPRHVRFASYLITADGQYAVLQALISRVAPSTNQTATAPAVAVLQFKGGLVETEDWYYNMDQLH